MVPVASGSGGFDEAYSVDLVGRLSSWTTAVSSSPVVRSFVYGDVAHPDAPTSNGVLSVSYDANGSAQTRGGVVLSWDALHRLVGIAGTQANVYGNDGTRLLRTDLVAGSVTLFLPGQQVTGPVGAGAVTGAVRSYSLGGVSVATRTGGGSAGVFWECGQRQGSVACSSPIGVGSSPVVPGLARYRPYGSPRAGSAVLSGTERGFVGQITDVGGLAQLGQRVYDPGFGHFLSVDPLTVVTGDPYLYAAGNPITMSDPNGLAPNCARMGYEDTTRWDPVSHSFMGSSSNFGMCAPTTAQAKHSTNIAKSNPTGGFGELLKSAVSLAAGALVGGICTGVGEAVTSGAGTPFVVSACAAAGGAVTRFTSGVLNGESVDDAMLSATDPSSVALDAALGFGLSKLATLRQGARATEGESGLLEGAVCSFDPDTQVQMADGTTKAIKNVAIGDSVEAADPSTGQDQGGRSVTALHRHQDDDLVDVSVTGRDGKLHIIHTTARHPFWEDTSKAWVAAGVLVAGEKLRTVDGRDVAVVDVSARAGQSEMLNLTVDGLHTFYVQIGAEAVLVHNTCGPDLDALSQSGQMPIGNQGMNKTGASLAQHGLDLGFTEADLAGGTANLNALGQDLLDDILTDPASRVLSPTSGNYAGGIRVISPTGAGATFDVNGVFRYFGLYGP